MNSTPQTSRTRRLLFKTPSKTEELFNDESILFHQITPEKSLSFNQRSKLLTDLADEVQTMEEVQELVMKGKNKEILDSLRSKVQNLEDDDWMYEKRSENM